MVVETSIRVVVHYIAAAEPFKDAHADRSETVGHLKARVLLAFGLTEGPTPEGSTVSLPPRFFKRGCSGSSTRMSRHR